MVGSARSGGSPPLLVAAIPSVSVFSSVLSQEIRLHRKFKLRDKNLFERCDIVLLVKKQHCLFCNLFYPKTISDFVNNRLTKLQKSAQICKYFEPISEIFEPTLPEKHIRHGDACQYSGKFGYQACRYGVARIFDADGAKIECNYVECGVGRALHRATQAAGE